MKKIIALLIVAFTFSAFTLKNGARKVINTTYQGGEQLEYRIHYGFITAGYATIKVMPKYFEVNDKTCYLVDVFGRTTGTFSLMMDVDDRFQSYIDTSSLAPQRFHRDISENKYKLKETTYFDHESNRATVVKHGKGSKNYEIPSNVHDMISGYYWLRNVNFKHLKHGEVITVPGFFEDTRYDMKVRYMGERTVKTKFGKLKSHVLRPIMPDNSLFDGEDSIEIFISADRNKIPLKVKAKMFIGSFEIDIKDYKGLRY